MLDRPRPKSSPIVTRSDEQRRTTWKPELTLRPGAPLPQRVESPGGPWRGAPRTAPRTRRGQRTEGVPAMDSPPHSIGQVNKGYRQCRFITRGTARNLYYAFLPLTLQQRRSLCAVFRFCRRCGDIADSPAAPEAKARALLEQELLIHRLYGGEDFHGDPEAAALADTIRRYRIPQRYFCDFLAGIRRDLVTVRYWSFEELRTYCYGVASAVGLIALEIIGYDRRRTAEARA